MSDINKRRGFFAKARKGRRTGEKRTNGTMMTDDAHDEGLAKKTKLK